MAETVAILAVLRGAVRPFGPPGKRSAIDKRPVEGPVAVTRLGIEGDRQALRGLHGGPEKALHHYPFDHYAAWRAEMASPLLDAPGAFGENLSTLGLAEEGVCVGDLFRLGSALVEVSQPRDPCLKLNWRFGRPGMARRVQESGRCGWYCRVREPGTAAAGDALAPLDRPHPGWSVARLLGALYGAGEDGRPAWDRGELKAIAGLGALAPPWRDLARRRLERGRVEDWRRRLGE